ncbi:MAG: hypothetical protein IKO52_03230 [Clostridia bacterium]|nr:hypothetical protein [Clostridia bacterium]
MLKLLEVSSLFFPAGDHFTMLTFSSTLFLTDALEALPAMPPWDDGAKSPWGAAPPSFCFLPPF